MDRHDTILCEFIKIMPIVFGINDIIDKANLYKSSNKKLAYSFTYPGYGKVLLNQNDLKKLCQKALCTTPLRVFTEICFLVKRKGNHQKRILCNIFVFLYLIRKTFYELSKALMTSREYINTCKKYYYNFIINFPIVDKPKNNKKLYTNCRLIQIETIACNKKIVDPFKFNQCLFNINNLNLNDLKSLDNYLDKLEECITQKMLFDASKIIIDPTSKDTIDINIGSGTQIIEFTRPINICDIQCKDCELTYS